MRWYCYACGKTQRIEVECRCEFWKGMTPWLRDKQHQLIEDISPTRDYDWRTRSRWPGMLVLP